MNKTLKFAHVLGLVMLLGSVLTYLVISGLTKSASLQDLLFARRIIRAGTLYLTVPGAWLIALSGVAIAARRFHGRPVPRWVRVKLAITLAILLNSHLLIVPATGALLQLAEASIASRAVVSEYTDVYLQRESIPGAVNVLLMLIATAIGVRSSAA